MNPPDQRPFLVGITGGIGAGKSTISKVFEVLNVPVYYADDRAKWLMENHQDLVRELKKTFGEETFIGPKLNAEHLRKTAFSDSDQREKLNKLVHPRVGEDFSAWVIENNEHPYLIKEAALLIESGSYKELDLLVGVFANEEERIRRVLKRDPFRNEDQVKNIIASQMKEDEMRKYCQLQIENEGKVPVLQEILNFDLSLKDHLAQKA